MYIEVDKEKLLRAITIADSIISTKQVSTVLSNCLFIVERDGIIIVSTDNEIGIKTRIERDSSDAGRFIVNGRKLANILRELPAGDVKLDVDDNFHIDVKTKSEKVKGHYTIIGSGSDEFPDVPSYSDEDVIEIDQFAMKDMIRQVVYAAATDTIKPVFNGVYIVSESENELTMVASDSRRLSLISKTMDSGINIQNGIIIPLKTVHELQRILAAEGTCRMFLGERQCFFKVDKTEIVTRIIDGQFPNFRQVIPKESRIYCIINREKLLESLRRAMIFSREPANKIVLHFEKGNLKIEARTPDLGEAEEDIDIENDFDEKVSIGINGQYMIDALREMSGVSVKVGITGSMNPVILFPEDTDRFVAVIMPIQLRSENE